MKDKYTCIIVDDEPLARRLLTNYVHKTPHLKLADTFKNALEVIEFLNTNTVDLLFSDIRMPGLSGIGLVEGNENLPAIIFTTAYEEYAVKAFELAVIDYLVKPFPLERFQKAVKKFEDYTAFKRGESDDKHLMVKANHGFLKIPHEKIIYVEANGEYMKLFLMDDLPELIYMRMKELERLLGDAFIRIHKSYLVNRNKISKLSGDYITVGDETLKVSRLYKKDVVAALNI